MLKDKDGERPNRPPTFSFSNSLVTSPVHQHKSKQAIYCQGSLRLKKRLREAESGKQA